MLELIRVAAKSFNKSYMTMNELIDIYQISTEAELVIEKTKAARRRHLLKIREALGEFSLHDLKPSDVLRVVNTVAKDHPQDARKFLIEIRRCLNFALLEDVVQRNVAAMVRAPKCTVLRERLTFEQWRDIYVYANKHMQPWVSRMMLLALITGQRRSDLFKMRFSDVYDGLLHIEQFKTHERIALPLNLHHKILPVKLGAAIQYCRRYAGGNEFLIRKHNGAPPQPCYMSAAFESAREAVYGKHQGEGYPPSLHECRALAARLYEEAGVNVQRLLGHSSLRMTYLYLNDRGVDRDSFKILEFEG